MNIETAINQGIRHVQSCIDIDLKTIRMYLVKHLNYTKSEKARYILNNWHSESMRFFKIN